MDKLVKILGWTPSKDFKKELLEKTKAEGLPIEEIAARYQMPVTFYDFDYTGYIDTDEGRMLIEDYKKANPWRKIVIIHGPESRRNKTKSIVNENNN